MKKLQIKLFYGEGLDTLEGQVNTFLTQNNLLTENFISFNISMADGNKKYFCATLVFRKEI